MRFLLTLPFAVVGLSAVTAGGIAAAFLTGHRAEAWVVFPVVAVLAGIFLYYYAQRPGPLPRTPPAPPDAEPFVDPVEEADRLAAGTLPEAGAGMAEAEPDDGSDPVEEADRLSTGAAETTPEPPAP